ncbi:CHC2 zinc finger domain-containing protein, partial [Prevotellamassilia timonensis]
MIPDDIKDRILEATDLVALVSQTVQLKKSGPRYVGCCPFHAEKTPSFYV